jgi:hypothetical protein
LLLFEFQLFGPPACAVAAGTLKLEHTLSDFLNKAHGLSSAEIT